MIPELRKNSYEERQKECGFNNPRYKEVKRRSNLNVMVLNGYENIDRTMFFIQER